MEKIIIIALLALFAFVVAIVIKNNKTAVNGNTPVNKTKIQSFFSNHHESKRGTSGETIRWPRWSVHILDKNGNAIKSEPISFSGRKSFSIGYDERCNLTIDSKYVSNIHLRVAYDGSGYFAKDAGSTNGTFIGNKEVGDMSFPLKDGMVVHLADVPICFTESLLMPKNIVPNFTKNVDVPGNTKIYDASKKIAVSDFVDKDEFDMEVTR